MDERCNNCKTELELCCYCDDGSQFKPKSNADKIREMSDEELAEFLRNYRGNPCDYCLGCDDSCRVNTLKWLKSEVKE